MSHHADKKGLRDIFFCAIVTILRIRCYNAFQGKRRLKKFAATTD